MRILHYSLGLEKYRGGGLSKYANDLALKQSHLGHEVLYCWPGRLSPLSKSISMRKRSLETGFVSCEMVNMLPVPGVMGIRDIDMYCERRNAESINRLMHYLRPDIVHIHTLMGLPHEVLTVFREAGVPVVFTVHDYFGLCPRASLYNMHRNCNCEESMRLADCAFCCTGAFSRWQLYLQQSGSYRKLKANRAISSFARTAWRQCVPLRKGVTPSVVALDDGKNAREDDNEGITLSYQKLLSYFADEFREVSLALYNSYQTKSVFERFGANMPGHVVPVTHSGVSDHRVLRFPSKKVLRIAYLSSCDMIKGLSVAIEAVREVRRSGRDVILNVYNDDVQEEDGIVRKGAYKTEDLGLIFAENDCSVTPSLWFETFSFTTLESLSYGVPALVTDKVGARYLVEEDGLGIVYDGSVKELNNVIRLLFDNRGLVTEMSKRICECSYLPLSYAVHVEEILDVYNEVIGW